MTSNLFIGTVLIAVCVLAHMGGLLLLATVTPRAARALRLHNHDLGRSIVMTGSVLGLFALHTSEVWLWAMSYSALGVERSFADALDLSTAMFSTVGYGPIGVPPEWRQLTALEGIAGFILIGWSTAYLVGASTRHGPFRKGEHF
jgi:hypothetical protein